jgi:hypothetical protein
MAYEIRMTKKEEDDAREQRLRRNGGEPSINHGRDSSNDSFMRDYMNNRNT